MCQQCEEWPTMPHDAPPQTRPVPYSSGEGAIYTPEYLARKEGNAKGVQPGHWRSFTVPAG
jgi:hypothetical protein